MMTPEQLAHQIDALDRSIINALNDLAECPAFRRNFPILASLMEVLRHKHPRGLILNKDERGVPLYRNKEYLDDLLNFFKKCLKKIRFHVGRRETLRRNITIARDLTRQLKRELKREI